MINHEIRDQSKLFYQDIYAEALLAFAEAKIVEAIAFHPAVQVKIKAEDTNMAAGTHMQMCI